jgi:HEAT repeat protein
MRNHIVLVIAVVALILAGVDLIFSKGGDRVAEEVSRPAEESQVRFEELNGRLDRLESQLRSAMALMQGSSPRPGAQEAARGPAETGAQAPAGPGEVAGLSSRMEILSHRIEALEQDPINRGYVYSGSESAALRRQGILSLKQFAGADPAARETIRNLVHDPNVEVRREAVDALGDLGDRESAGLVAEMLNDPDPGVRREAIDSFADWGHGEATPLISRMLNDADENVRREALRALSALGAKQSGAEIARLLSDPSEQVRNDAADVLGQLKSGEGTTALLQALNDPSERVRGEAIASLGEVGAVESLPYLRDLYQRDQGRNSIRLVMAMRALGDEQPYRQEIQRLSGTALSGNNTEARRQAIRTLSWLARDEAKDVLTRALQDPDESIRREAERALRGDRGGDRRRGR